MALMLVGAVAQTVAAASIRKRSSLLVLGLVLTLTGFLLPKDLGDQPWRIALGLVTAAIILTYAGIAIWRVLRQPKSTKTPRDVHA